MPWETYEIRWFGQQLNEMTFRHRSIVDQIKSDAR